MGETYNRRPVRGRMAPPPVPIDPAIDTWRPSSIAISHTTGFDNLLPLSLGLPDRLNPCHPSDQASPAHEVHLPAMKQTAPEPDPLLRFWNETGPWNSQRLSGDPGHAPMNPQFPHFHHRMPRNGHALQYEYRSPRSDVGSSTTGRYPFDSGYGGSRSLGTKSVRSADQLDQSPSSQSAAGDVRDLHLCQEGNFQDALARSATSPNPQYSSMDVSNDAPQSPAMAFDMTCQYPNCNTISKNHSEHRWVHTEILAGQYWWVMLVQKAYAPTREALQMRCTRMLQE